MTDVTPDLFVEELKAREILLGSEAKKPTKRNKGKKLVKMTLNDILELSCWNPDDFDQWHKFLSERSPADNEPTPYPGVRVYEIQTHCRRITIKAKKHSNGGYQIMETIVQEH